MDKNLKNALIVIGVIVVLYYVISPYQNCMRYYEEPDKQMRSKACNLDTKW